MIPDLNVNKEKTVHYKGNIFYRDCMFKAKTGRMLSLVFEKLNLCLVMLASQGVNPLATSHTVEHLSSIYLHSWSHDKPIFYLIYHYLNKIDIAWNI